MAKQLAVLVIDDDSDVLAAIRSILEDHGYAVHTASSQNEGLEVFKARSPDLVICDMMMEQVDSGILLATDVRRLDDKVPVYLMSSIGEGVASHANIEDLGFSGVLQKPVSASSLLAAAEGALQQVSSPSSPSPKEAGPTPINDEELIRRVLSGKPTVAMVGLSANPERASNLVARTLIENGFEVVPVNPKEESILGRTSYPSLEQVPGAVDVVDVFRRSEEVAPIVDAAIEKGAKVLWMQLGVINEEAAKRALEAGLEVVMDRCMKRELEHLTFGQQE